MDLSALAERVESAGFGPIRWQRNGTEFKARCCCHEERTASANFKTGSTGNLIAFCFGCGAKGEQIAAALGIDIKEFFANPRQSNGSGPRTNGPGRPYQAPPQAQNASQRQPPKESRPLLNPTTTRYRILSPEGELKAVHVRIDGTNQDTGKPAKRMWWELPDGTKGLGGLSGSDLPLYGSQLLRNHPDEEMPIVCEGEKACQALIRRGLPAVGTVCGAAAIPSDESLRPLVRFASVTLWPDNDDPGRAHMARVGDSLKKLGAKDIRMVAALGEKGDDAADITEDSGIMEALAAAKDWTRPPGDLIISGQTGDLTARAVTEGLVIPWETRSLAEVANEAYLKRTAVVDKLMYTSSVSMVTGGKHAGKCFGRGTLILMSNGAAKPVELVKAGDCVMGPDSKPRLVVGTNAGRAPLFRIRPVRGEPFICNGDHVLVLWRHAGDRRHTSHETEVSVNDFLRRTKTQGKTQFRYQLMRKPVDYPERPLEIDPYILGAWLGDGHTDQARITTGDAEIEAEIRAYGYREGFTVRVVTRAENCVTLGIAGGFQSALRTLGVLGSKHIPAVHKIASRAQRLELLAGLIDTDGNLNHNAYDLIFKSLTLATDARDLARSLGFAAEVKRSVRSCQTGATGIYWRLLIRGPIQIIPVRVSRKKGCRTRGDNVLRTGFTIEPLDEGEFFGFQVEGDGRFLLGDGTLTHNSTLVRWLAICVAKGLPFLDRAVTQGPVFYIASEDETMAARQELIRLGWNEQDPLRFLSNSDIEDQESFLAGLGAVIRREGAVLTVLDMLFDFVRISDEMSYAGTRDAVGKIQNVATEGGSHIVTVHHAPKNALINEAAVAALGSQGLAARVSPIILVRRFGPGVHSISSTSVRDPRGEQIADSRLIKNSDGSVILGGAFKIRMLTEIHTPRIKEFLAEEPGSEFTAGDIKEQLDLSYEVARACLANLYKSGEVERTGAGKKGKPFRYAIYAPDISAANEKNAPTDSPTSLGNVEKGESLDFNESGRFGFKD